MAHKPMKQAVIAPSDARACCTRWTSEIPGYSREQFEEDLVNECEKDIRQAFAASAAAGVRRLHRGAAGHQGRPAQPVDRARACCRTSSS